MNKVTVMKKNEEITNFETSILPDVGEFLWLDSSIDNPVYYKVIGKVFDVDVIRRRMNITLMVE